MQLTQDPQKVVNYFALVWQKNSFCVLSEHVEWPSNFAFVFKNNLGGESGDLEDGFYERKKK
jgi:hypothetical protein